MSFVNIPERWKEWYGSGTFSELLELYKDVVEKKKNSRILIKKKDIVWDSRHPQARAASVIDPRIGFTNSIANLGLSEIGPGTSTGKHKHGEALVYILAGSGYSVIGGKRYDWDEGDGIYIPPDTYHQHFNTDKTKAARFLRVVPGVLQMNLLAIGAAINMGPAYNVEQAEERPGYKS